MTLSEVLDHTFLVLKEGAIGQGGEIGDGISFKSGKSVANYKYSLPWCSNNIEVDASILNNENTYGLKKITEPLEVLLYSTNNFSITKFYYGVLGIKNIKQKDEEND